MQESLKENAFVDIILPNYNKAKFLQEQLVKKFMIKLIQT